MVKLIKVKDIFSEFLRAVYKEPARSGLSKRHTSVVDESKSPGNGVTELTVSNTKLLCINAVTVDAVTQVKYVDFDIDLRNNKIIFASSFAGTETVLISYDYNTSGISWINPDNPQRDDSDALTRVDYPRVVVQEADSSHNFVGMGSDSQLSSVPLAITVATKNKLKATNYIRVKTDGSTETVSETALNTDLVEVLAMGIVNAVKRNWRDDVQNKLFLFQNAFRSISPTLPNMDKDLFVKEMIIEVHGFDLGEDD